MINFRKEWGNQELEDEMEFCNVSWLIFYLSSYSQVADKRPKSKVVIVSFLLKFLLENNY